MCVFVVCLSDWLFFAVLSLSKMVTLPSKPILTKSDQLASGARRSSMMMARLTVCAAAGQQITSPSGQLSPSFLQQSVWAEGVGSQLTLAMQTNKFMLPIAYYQTVVDNGQLANHIAAAADYVPFSHTDHWSYRSSTFGGADAAVAAATFGQRPTCRRWWCCCCSPESSAIVNGSGSGECENEIEEWREWSVSSERLNQQQQFSSANSSSSSSSTGRPFTLAALHLQQQQQPSLASPSDRLNWRQNE